MRGRDHRLRPVGTQKKNSRWLAGSMHRRYAERASPSSDPLYAVAARATAATESVYSRQSADATASAGSSPNSDATYENAPPAAGVAAASST